MKRILLLLTLIFPFTASASNFSVGVGGQWSEATLKSTTQHTDVAYDEPGALLDARVRFGDVFNTGDLALDIFGAYGVLSNFNHGGSETLLMHQYGGGIDIRKWNFFVGGQYMATDATITGGPYSQATALNLEMYGFRAGLDFNLSDNTSIMFGGVYEQGTAGVTATNPTSQPVTRLSGFLILHYALVNDLIRTTTPAKP